MIIRVDAQLSPFIANWINVNFSDISAHSVRSLKLEEANDYDIFRRARKAKSVVMGKDYDFVKLIEVYGVPPKLIWITCGNTSNKRVCEILALPLQQAIDLLNQNENTVEISDKSL